MVFSALKSDLYRPGSTGTCHPRQCSSSDCRGTQLIRHGNDGSMLLTSALLSGGVFPSVSSARDPFHLFWMQIITVFYSEPNMLLFGTFLADYAIFTKQVG